MNGYADEFKPFTLSLGSDVVAGVRISVPIYICSYVLRYVKHMLNNLKI